MLVGNIASVVGYWVGGRLTLVDLTLGAAFLVPMGLGLALGFGVRHHLVGPRLRRAVLMVVSLSALMLLGTAVTG